jgi:hypothetical protein
MALAGELQIVPHLPQFEVSAVRSTHEPLQGVSAPQSAEQTPALHTLAAPQAVAQSPQC